MLPRTATLIVFLLGEGFMSTRSVGTGWLQCAFWSQGSMAAALTLPMAKERRQQAQSTGMLHAVRPTKDGDRPCSGLGSKPSASDEAVSKLI